MNKQDLIDAVYSELDLTKENSQKAVDQMLDKMVEAVTSGEGIYLRKLGKLEPRPRDSTMAVHPETGEKIRVGRRVRPYFSPSESLSKKTGEALKVVKEDDELKIEQK